MKKTLLLLAALTLSPALYAQDYHVVLWDNATAPTSNGLTGEELQPKPGQWSNTQKAEMWIYKAGDNATGQALVFFPGGGYSTLSVGNGHKEAKWFAENGVTAAVVKYRLPNGHSEVPRNDADEALRVMREMAAELNIVPARVRGVGHLGGRLSRRQRGYAFGSEARFHDPLLPGDFGRRRQTPQGDVRAAARRRRCRQTRRAGVLARKESRCPDPADAAVPLRRRRGGACREQRRFSTRSSRNTASRLRSTSIRRAATAGA